MIFAVLLASTLLSSTLLSFEPDLPIDFDSQVLPVLTKVGCNSGACHGAAAGRGGFHLSLFGSDPQADYDSIVLYAEGRRINVIDTSKSVILAKPMGELDHGGDVVLHEGTSEVALLRRWLQAGAKRGAMHRLVDLRVDPQEAIATMTGEAISLRAIARFSNGEEADVTQWTQFRSEDNTAAEVLSQPMRAKLLRPGKHLVMARFWNRIVPVSLSLPFRKATGDAGQPISSNSFVDAAIYSQLSQLNLTALDRIGGAAFVRRLQLDLTGRLPLPEELLPLVSDDTPKSREAMINRLLASDDFSTFWGLRMARWFMMRGMNEERQATQAYSDWILQSMKDRRPYNDIVRELLTATGDSHIVGAVNFARTAADARQHAELVSSVLMGTRIQCANCHNHPYARWTQDDYHGMAAIFARLDRSRIVALKPQGAVTNIRTGETATARIPGVRYLNENETALQEFTDWLLDNDNPTLARATVNRLWDALMGRGLVAGVDDFRETNPASHSQLLDELAKDFSANGYDIRCTIRLIVSSNAYARRTDAASHPAGSSIDLERWYGAATRKPLLPEVHLDAIDDVLNNTDKFISKDRPRAISRLDPAFASTELDALGRCSNSEACQTQGPIQGLAPKLYAINGELLNRRISHRDGRLQSYLRDGMQPRSIIEDFYVRALSRRPDETQLRDWLAELNGLTSEEQGRWLEDFVWAILSSQDFSTNR